MPTHTATAAAPATAPSVAQEARRLGTLSAFAAVYTYALIVFGGIVRITGSGMGCGDDWPRCNGEWIPAFTFETLIEYTHRLLAAGIGVVVLAVFLYALVHRTKPGVRGAGGALRPLIAAATLLVVQVALGAITVRLELPTSVTVAHFITAMLFMAALVAAATRTGTFGEPIMAADPADARSAWRAAIAATLLGLAVVSLGALTANTPAAPQACRGFPLCNGMLFPMDASTTAHIHATHRLLAFLLLFHLLGATLRLRRRDVSRHVRTAARLSLALVATQFAIAAALVILPLPWQLQALHLAVGAAIWFALVAWASLAAAQRDAAIA